jgi:hypothetical protein
LIKAANFSISSVEGGWRSAWVGAAETFASVKAARKELRRALVECSKPASCAAKVRERSGKGQGKVECSKPASCAAKVRERSGKGQGKVECSKPASCAAKAAGLDQPFVTLLLLPLLEALGQVRSRGLLLISARCT